MGFSFRAVAVALVLLVASTAAAAPINIACLGDSITLTAISRSPNPYPHKLEMLLNTAVPGAYTVMNFGVGATTSSQHVTTWTNSIRNKGYNVIVILSGVNDMITDVTAATAWTNINTIVTQALADGMTVVLVTVLPWATYSSWTADRQTQTDALLTSIRARAGVILVDLYPSFEQDAGGDALKTAYDFGDGLHPNETGANALAAAVKTAMGL